MNACYIVSQLSILPFLSKVVERVVAIQLTEYVNAHSLTEPLQSAYRQYHSTVTALTYGLNDILMSLDQKKAVLLVLLDLSAEFDTVDHKLLTGFASVEWYWTGLYLICLTGLNLYLLASQDLTPRNF